MSLLLPTSDRNRLDTLDSILLLSVQAVSPGKPDQPSDGGTVSGQSTDIPTVPLPTNLNQQIKKCRAEIFGLVRESKQLQQNKTEDRETRDVLISKARSYLQHYWSALNLYCETSPEAENPKAFYGMVDGYTTKFSTMQILRTGEQILKSVENAESEGMPVITLGNSQGSFEETITELAKVMARMAQVAEGKTERKTKGDEARKACHSVLRKVAAYLRFAYNGYTPVDVREKMRAYGFKFKTQANDDQTANVAEGTQVQTTDENQTSTDENQAVSEMN